MMSYEEKGVWVELVVTLALYATYVALILGRANGGPLAEVAYVATLLWTIGATIGVTVAARIVVEIVRPSESYTVDERDKAVHRFGDRVGHLVLAVGMLLPLGLTLAALDHFWIANAIYAVFVVATVSAAPVKLVAWRRGF